MTAMFDAVSGLVDHASGRLADLGRLSADSRTTLLSIGRRASDESLFDFGRREAGTWIDAIPGMDDLALMVRSMHSAAFRLASCAEGVGSPGGPIVDRRGRVACALLRGWRHLSLDGRPVPYEPGLARRWLCDGAHGALVDAVYWAAERV